MSNARRNADETSTEIVIFNAVTSCQVDDNNSYEVSRSDGRGSSRDDRVVDGWGLPEVDMSDGVVVVLCVLNERL